MSEPWNHHATVVNGFRMHHVIAGSGYPLVLLHGWPQSWYGWRKIIPALAEKFTVIAPDLRGLGDSERENVQGGELKQCGHFIAEEKPEFATQQALEFFAPLRGAK